MPRALFVILAFQPGAVAAGEVGAWGGVAPSLPIFLPPLELGALERHSVGTRVTDPPRRALSGNGEEGRFNRLSPSETPKGSKSRWSKRLYLSAALTVSAGILARWTKHEADRSYDEYLKSASPVRQHDAFGRAERYDRMSGVALAAMEAGIILSTYLIFF